MQCINMLAETAHSWLDKSANKVKKLEHQMERLADRICSMSEDNGKLVDRTLFLEGSLHTIQIISKMRIFKNMDSFVVGESKKLTDSLVSLESYMIQEIQTLKEAMQNRFQALEDF